MAKPYIIAFFNNENDLQQTINTLIQAGYNTNRMSMVMKNSVKKDKEMMAEPYDENDPFTEAKGTIEPVEGEALDTQQFNIPELGDIVVAGPLVSKLDEVEFSDSIDGEQSRLDEALSNLGIIDEEIEGCEERINGGQILVVMHEEEDNIDEVAIIFSDNGGYLLNYDSPMN